MSGSLVPVELFWFLWHWHRMLGRVLKYHQFVVWDSAFSNESSVGVPLWGVVLGIFWFLAV